MLESDAFGSGAEIAMYTHTALEESEPLLEQRLGGQF